MHRQIFTRISRNIHTSKNQKYWDDISKKLERLDDQVKSMNSRVHVRSYGPGVFSIAGGIFGGLWLADMLDVNPFDKTSK